MATGKEKVYLVGGGRTYEMSLDEIVQYAQGNITLPAPTTTVRGGVLRGAAVANATVAADGTSAGTQLNALLAQLRIAGIIPAS